MKLYDYFRSTAAYRVRIALHLKQITYEAIPVHLLNDGGEQFFAAYHKINPQQLVPTLIDDHQIFTQSLAIIEYLDECYNTPPLLPTTSTERAHVRSLALSIACDLHPLNNLRVLNQLRQQFSANDEQITTWYHHWLKVSFDALERQLERFSNHHTFCFGDALSLADLCLIPQVYNAKRFAFSMENYPIIQKINAHCLSLTAFKAAAPQE